MKDNAMSESGKGGKRFFVRFLLAFLCLGCLAGAGYLGWMGLEEVREYQKGEDFYAALAVETIVEAEALHTAKTQADIRATVTEAPVTEPAEVTVEPAPATTEQVRQAEPAEVTVEPVPAITEQVRQAEPAATADVTDQPAATAVLPVTTEAVVTAAVTRAPVQTPVPTKSVLETQKPLDETETIEKKSAIDFAALQESCPDVVGWIRIEDTEIDYPIVLGEDNDFYLAHLPDGTANKAGSIMMDEANTGDFTQSITILHGHNMRNGSMFGRLDDYAKAEYYRQHPMIQLYTSEGDYEVAVFAAATVNGYTFGYPTSFEDETAFDQFIRRAISATPYETGVEVRYGEHILMLSTCAYSFNGARYVVMGKIMDETLALQADMLQDE